jgi:hypothetical protein
MVMCCVCRLCVLIGIHWTKLLVRWDYVAPVPRSLNKSRCARQFERKSLGMLTASSLVSRNDIPDLESARPGSTTKPSRALLRSGISLRETRELAVNIPRFRATDQARATHAVGFSPTSQFEQCHRYVLRAARLWLDRVMNNG